MLKQLVIQWCCELFLGAGQVFVDLERSAVAVIRATGKEASKTVGHK